MKLSILPFRTAPLLLLLALGACAGRGAEPPGEGVPTVQTQKRKSSLLTGEEIRGTYARDAYDLVEKLRPHWLRVRGTNAPDADGSVDVQVYYNNQLMGSREALRLIDPGKVISIEYVGGILARSRWGAGHGRGVIYIVGQ